MLLAFLIEVLPWKPQIDFDRTGSFNIPKCLTLPLPDDRLRIAGADPGCQQVIGVQVGDQSCRFDLCNRAGSQPEVVPLRVAQLVGFGQELDAGVVVE